MGLWAETSETDRIRVDLTGDAGEPDYAAQPGDQVDFTGQVLANDAGFAEQLGTDTGEGTELLTTQAAHIEVVSPCCAAQLIDRRPLIAGFTPRITAHRKTRWLGVPYSASCERGDRGVAVSDVAGSAPIDFAAVFAAAPSPYLLLRPDLTICDANAAYLTATGRSRDDLVGRSMFEAFPDNPAQPDADGVANLRASLERARATGRPDVMAVQRYDIPMADGRFEMRYWSPINIPVRAADGSAVLLLHRVEDVTALVATQQPGGPTGTWSPRTVDQIAGQMARADDLHQAHDRDRDIATRLQDVMLPRTPTLVGPARIATRYHPATRDLAVGGDWYDVIELDDGRIAVAVGDVAGHGLAAAAAMGQLRGALSAAIRATGKPAQALRVLDAHARDCAAPMATVVSMVLDLAAGVAQVSSAGHPPPLIVAPDGTASYLAIAPGLPVPLQPSAQLRPRADVTLPTGGVVVLYSDGLVERRREVLDEGLALLADVVAGHRDLEAEALADVIEARVAPRRADQDDDLALVVVRL